MYLCSYSISMHTYAYIYVYMYIDIYNCGKKGCGVATIMYIYQFV